MKDFNSMDDILDFAIKNEQKAIDLYTRLAGTAKTNDMRETFEEFTKEEVSHKARLTKIKKDDIFNMPTQEIETLKIADYIIKVEEKEGMSYEDTLILAMNREKAAFKLYSKLAEKAPNDKLKKIFKALAIEESKHKLRFELEYDEHILK